MLVLLLLPLLLSAASAMLRTPAAPIPQFWSSTCLGHVQRHDLQSQAC